MNKISSVEIYMHIFPCCDEFSLSLTYSYTIFVIDIVKLLILLKT